jgi:hypothetical protein
MNKQQNMVSVMLTTGIIMAFVQMVIRIGMHFYPQPAIRLFGSSTMLESTDILRSPLLFLQPAVHFCIMLMLYLLLRSQNKKPGSLSGLLLVVLPLVSVVETVIGVFVNMIQNHYLSMRAGAAAFAAVSIVRTASSYLTVIFSPAMLLFAAAAGICWSRRERGEQ